MVPVPLAPPPHALSQKRGISIQWQELFPIYLACILWGLYWSGKRIRMWCDNKSGCHHKLQTLQVYPGNWPRSRNHTSNAQLQLCIHGCSHLGLRQFYCWFTLPFSDGLLPYPGSLRVSPPPTMSIWESGKVKEPRLTQNFEHPLLTLISRFSTVLLLVVFTELCQKRQLLH